MTVGAGMSILRKRACWLADADILKSKLDRVIDLVGLKYGPGQARVPAGSPDGGQWTSGSNGTPSSTLFAGGFDKDDFGKSVQQFVAEKCRASIYSVLPGEFLEKTVTDVVKSARSGSATGRRCMKLLREDRFRK